MFIHSRDLYSPARWTDWSSSMLSLNVSGSRSFGVKSSTARISSHLSSRALLCLQPFVICLRNTLRFAQPRPQGAFPWLLEVGWEKPGKSAFGTRLRFARRQKVSSKTQGQLVGTIECSFWKFTVRSRRDLTINFQNEHSWSSRLAAPGSPRTSKQRMNKISPSQWPCCLETQNAH